MKSWFPHSAFNARRIDSPSDYISSCQMQSAATPLQDMMLTLRHFLLVLQQGISEITIKAKRYFAVIGQGIYVCVGLTVARLMPNRTSCLDSGWIKSAVSTGPSSGE